MRQFIERNINDNRDHERMMREAGVTQEQLWIQHAPGGEYAIACIRADDPARALRHLLASDDPWAKNFREFLADAHGMDLTQAVSMNEELLNWNATERNRVDEDKNAMK